jgi:CheY-like chemotaxis protein
LLLDASGIPHEVTAVEDGQMALAFLNRDAPFLKAPTPALVLLDLGLPKVHGVAVLQQIARLSWTKMMSRTRQRPRGLRPHQHRGRPKWSPCCSPSR